MLEDAAPFLQNHFAFNISKGLFPEASELGVYYSDLPYRSNEAHQQILFLLQIVEGNDQLFYRITVTPNGTLEIELTRKRMGLL